MLAYVQPVAQHQSYPERLVVRSIEGRWYVWFGDRAGTPLEEVDPPVADWLQGLSMIAPIPEPRFWLHVDDLPLLGSAARLT
jgi:hypothetical protein